MSQRVNADSVPTCCFIRAPRRTGSGASHAWRGGCACCWQVRGQNFDIHLSSPQHVVNNIALQSTAHMRNIVANRSPSAVSALRITRIHWERYGGTRKREHGSLQQPLHGPPWKPGSCRLGHVEPGPANLLGLPVWARSGLPRLFQEQVWHSWAAGGLLGQTAICRLGMRALS